MDFAVLAYNWVKIKESEKMETYLDLDGEIKETVEHKGDSDTNCSGCTCNGSQKIGGIGNRGKNRDHQDHSIVKIAKNIQKSSEDLRRLAVTKNPKKEYQRKKKLQGFPLKNTNRNSKPGWEIRLETRIRNLR